MTAPDRHDGQLPGCARVSDCAAYLLGGLSADERADYARHLAGCPVCTREVVALAGLPALLTRLHTTPAPDDPDRETGDVDPDPRDRFGQDAPQEGQTGDDPVVAAVAAVRRARTRRRRGMAAAAVLVAGALGGSVLAGRATVAAPPDPGPVLAMQAVADGSVTATFTLTDRPWGTAITMTCHYSPEYATAGTDVLLVHGTDGAAQELARWSALPGKATTVSAVTELRGAALRGLEVRTTTGRVLLHTA